MHAPHLRKRALEADLQRDIAGRLLMPASNASGTIDALTGEERRPPLALCGRRAAGASQSAWCRAAHAASPPALRSAQKADAPRLGTLVSESEQE
jgi:hypothetical protein